MSPSPTKTLAGTISAVTARNDLSGYTVFETVEDGDKSLIVAFLDTMPRVGETFAASGAWHHHPKYGRQFKADTVTVTAPASSQEMVTFLASGLFPGIGEGIAKRIVNLFGPATLEILDTDPRKLLMVGGIGRAKLDAIVQAWKEHHGMRDVTLFLAPHGFSLSLSAKIWKKWGDQSLNILKDEPYRLYHEFTGAAFQMVDRMALVGLKFAHDTIARCNAGIAEAMSRTYTDGHACLPRDELTERARKLLNVHGGLIVQAMDGMLRLGELFEEEWGGKKLVYLPSMRRAENDAAQRLVQISQSPALLSRFAHPHIVEQISKEMRLVLSPSQRNALEVLLRKPLGILTGGPGTGKTRLTQVICAAASIAQIPIHLAAPTGRASCRLAESTGMTAETIHRMLAFNPAMERFERNADAPLPKGLVLIDEASMIDVPLAAHLLRAITNGSQVIFVGDVHQLPAVGPGLFMADMIKMFPESTAYLTEIHRQCQGSVIVKNAHHLLHSEPIEESPRGAKSDFMFSRAESVDDVLGRLRWLIARLQEKGHALENIQILTPARKGPLGSIALNKVLQDCLNPLDDKDGPLSKIRFRLNDRVVHRTNDYDRELFNGTLGKISGINLDQRLAWIDFDERTIEFPFSDFESMDLAYALTTHRSQGSEYPIVITLLHTVHGPLLSRPLLYTAITRAKQCLAIIGEEKAVRIAAANCTHNERNSGLRYRIEAALSQGGCTDYQTNFAA